MSAVIFLLLVGFVSASPLWGEGTFQCDSSHVISYYRVNDGVCDCENGSDEPKTKACLAGGVRLRCSDGRLLFPEKYNNGVCDCCDGTDEPSKSCPYNCQSNQQARNPNLRHSLMSRDQAAAEATTTTTTTTTENGRSNSNALEQDLGYYRGLNTAADTVTMQMFHSTPENLSDPDVILSRDMIDDNNDNNSNNGIETEVGEHSTVRPADGAVVGNSYLSEPDISGDIVVFICDDQLWTSHVTGGDATQITNTPGEVKRPRFSPDGTKIAFSSNAEGGFEVFVVPTAGGPIERLTYLGYALVVDWSTDQSHIIFQAHQGTFHSQQEEQLHRVSVGGGPPVPLPVGWSHYIQFDPAAEPNDGSTGGVSTVVGRFTSDIGMWKRYKGGMKGVVFFDTNADSNFDFLLNIEGTIGLFVWLGDRLYFTADFHCLDKPYIRESFGNELTCASQLYSVSLSDGIPAKDSSPRLEQHTKWEMFEKFHRHNFYIRNPQSDNENRIVFEKGGDLFVFDVPENSVDIIPIRVVSDKPQLSEQHLRLADEIQRVAISNSGSNAVYIAHGRPVTQPILADGPIVQFGDTGGSTRYRQCEFIASGHIVCVSNTKHPSNDNDNIVLFNVGKVNVGMEVGGEGYDSDPTGNVVIPGGIGRIVSFVTAPTLDLIAICNHRHQLLVVNVPQRKVTTIEQASNPIHQISWSPDSQWLAYPVEDQREVTHIKIAHVPTTESFDATDGILSDHSPCWDPHGRFLYFLSNRDLEKGQARDTVTQEDRYVATSRPYLLLLSEDANVPSPFFRRPSGCPPGSTSDLCQTGVHSLLTGLRDRFDNSGRFVPDPLDHEDANPNDGWVRIPGWRHGNVREAFSRGERIIAFPLARGYYSDLWQLPNGIAFKRYGLEGDLGAQIGNSYMAFDLDSQEEYVLARNAYMMRVSADNSKVALFFSSEDTMFCVFPAEARGTFSPSVGICPPFQDEVIKIDPLTEWRQIFFEAWKYQRDNYWTATMMHLHWDYHKEMYQSLIPKFGARSQLNDLINMMQGDLGTSHAFYRSSSRKGATIIPSRLGCDVEWDNTHNGYKITRVVVGDVWNKPIAGPLSQPGINIFVGDVIVSIDNIELEEHSDPFVNLVGKRRVLLKVKIFNTTLQKGFHGYPPQILEREGDGQIVEKWVSLIRSEANARYRDWVQANREYVHKQSNNRLGYVHIPDMVEEGWVELHRHVNFETKFDGLVVDVRYNTGGMISDGIQDVLSRRTLGFKLTPTNQIYRSPRLSVPGPHILLLNEGCASDCEIFSQTICNRLRYPIPWAAAAEEDSLLGCVRIGTRSWGGVVGIDFKGKLVDGTATSQPEYAFWFYGAFPGNNTAKPDGYGVENFGVTPDEWVYTKPQDYANGKDPQLDAGIAKGLKILEGEDPKEANLFMQARVPVVSPHQDPLLEYGLSSNAWNF